MELPIDKNINVDALEHSFDHMSECYKLFWLKAILDSAKDGFTKMTFDMLTDDMIYNSWYMVTKYEIKLGPNNVLGDLVFYISNMYNLNENATPKEIKDSIASISGPSFINKKKNLINLVPYRFLSPFVTEINWDKSKEELALFFNNTGETPYYFRKIDGLKSEIEIYPEWLEYFIKNYDILITWIRRTMVEYLKKYNPNITFMDNKIILTETNIVKPIINENPIDFSDIENILLI